MLTRVRRWLARRRGAAAAAPAIGASPDPEFLYSVYWVKETSEWTTARRAEVGEALRVVLSAPDFAPNPTERRYTVAGLEGAYSGASLRALERVLVEWDKREG